MPNMLDKILFFDIDGTLAYHGKIPEDNLEVLRELKSKGYLTFICTGRPVHYAKKLFNDEVSGYISCNGRYIMYNNKKLLGKSLSKQETYDYIKECELNKIDYVFAGENTLFYGNASEKVVEELIKEYGHENISHIDKLGNNEVYTFDLYFKDPDRFTEVDEIFKDRLILNNHYQGSCDCTTINFHKGSAISYLLDYFNISKEDSFAFGDGRNDIYMFREAGNKIAMGNAIEDLKDKATYITADFDKKGIRKALEHYNILKKEL